MGAFGGFLSGIGQGVQNQQQADGIGAGGQKQPGGGGSSWGGLIPMITGKKPAAAPTSTTPAPVANTGTTIPNPQPGQQQHGFNGLVPMMKGYYAAHQAKVQDAAAAPHIDSLNDPSVTPEQQAYHLSNLQSIYAGRPEMLKQYGIQSPGIAPANVPSMSGGNQ